jgi:hypothetical protein
MFGYSARVATAPSVPLPAGVTTAGSEVTAARSRTLPLVEAFAGLVPGGVVQRGSTIGCSGAAAVSLALAMAAGPVGEGAWIAVAGLPTLGVRAAVELGVAIERLVMVAEPDGGLDAGRWADVVAAMIDGFDVVLLGPGARRIRPQVARRLQTRVQSRGGLLITVGVLDGFGCDLQLVTGNAEWDGLGEGHGVARARRVEVELRGRRVPQARRASLWLPDATGALRAVTPDAETGAPVAPVAPLRRTG